MNALRLSFSTLLVVALLASGCGASDVSAPVTGERFGPVPNHSGSNDGGDDGNGGNGGGDDDDDDSSGDDDDGEIGLSACEGHEVRVTSNGGSSARVSVNGTDVASPNDFPTSEAIVASFTAVSGENTIAVWIAGSTGDEISVDVTGPEGISLLSATVVRDGGQPEQESYTLAVPCAPAAE